MKLLFFDMQLPYLLKGGSPTGGAAVRQYAIVKGLKELDQEVGVLTFKGAKDFVGESDIELLECYDQKAGIKNLRVFYLQLPAIYRAIKAYKPDYILTKAVALTTGMTAFAGKLLNIPFIYLATSNKDADERFDEIFNSSVKWSSRFALNYAKMIICQNQYQYENFQKRYPHKKLSLMHNPFYYRGELPEILPQSERGYIAWVANFSDVKNVPAALTIVKKLPEVQFKFAGSVKSGKATLEAYEELKQCPNVELLGHIDRKNIIGFLSKAYAIMNTSHLEGFSNTFLEAFAAGTPVVTREEIDPDDLIATNNLGKIIKSYDEFPEAICSLINDPGFDDMAIRCRNYLMNNHDHKVQTQKIIDSLNELSIN